MMHTHLLKVRAGPLGEPHVRQSIVCVGERRSHVFVGCDLARDDGITAEPAFACVVYSVWLKSREVTRLHITCALEIRSVTPAAGGITHRPSLALFSKLLSLVVSPYLQAGDWEDALDAARIQHARQELLHDSSTCSTGSPFSMRGSPPPAAEAAGSYCYSDIIGPAPGVAVQLTAVYPSRSSLNISPGSWSVGSVGSPNAAVAGLAEADAAMTVDCAGGVLLGKVLEGELAARRCSSAYLGPSAAAAVGGLNFS